MTSRTTSTATGKLPQRGGRSLMVVIDDQVIDHALPDTGVAVIGRDASADIVIAHPTLSRRHAKLTLSTHASIEDCGSRNGIVIGGRKLALGEIVLVAPGVSVELGHALVILRPAVGTNDAFGSSVSEPSAGVGHAFDRKLARIAKAHASVLLAGESGVGKTFVAKRIHALSPRSAGPFVPLRCDRSVDATAIAAAATAAHGGVLFLHEPSLLTMEHQVVLANALATAAASFRTVTATTSDLPRLVERGAFEGELFDRLATVTLEIPPLRARLRELPAIVAAMVATIAAAQERPLPLVTADALAVLERHSWPGNVRELERALSQAMILQKGRVLTASHFAFVVEPAAGAAVGSLASAISDAEHRRILEVLRECDGNQTRAARMLGISRGTLISRLERYAIPRPRK